MPCEHCPHCQAARDPVAELRTWCVERGHWVGPGDVVTEQVAAEMLHKAAHTLRDWRSNGQPLAFLKTRAGVRYTLQAIVAFMQDESR
jgi:hypothetical protein